MYGEQDPKIWFDAAAFTCPSQIPRPKYIKSRSECGRVLRRRPAGSETGQYSPDGECDIYSWMYIIICIVEHHVRPFFPLSLYGEKAFSLS